MFKRVALSIPGFVGLSESSGGIPHWFVTTRLTEQSFEPLPHAKSLDQDAPSMGAMSVLPVGTAPSLSSGYIAFAFAFTRCSTRSLPPMHRALRKSLLTNGIANRLY